MADTAETVQLGLERRSDTGDLAPLLGYLALPSQTVARPANLACPAMAWSPPWLFLLDEQGRWTGRRSR